jgi:hypothetical protein
MFRPPLFGPDDNSTFTFHPMETGSQKRFIHVTLWTLERCVLKLLVNSHLEGGQNVTGTFCPPQLT